VSALAFSAALAVLVALFSQFGASPETVLAAQDAGAQDETQVFTDPGDSAGERYIVKFRDAGNSVRSSVRGRGGRIVVDMPSRRLIAARLSEQARRALEADPQVEYVEVDQKRYPLAGPPWGNVAAGDEIIPYGIQMVQADQLSDAAAGTRMVCIIDSGYFRAHDDLQYDNVTASPDIGTGDPFVDRSSHGTHVAGTIAAIGANGTGVRGVTQSQRLRLHIVKVFGDDGVYAYSSTLIHALTQCRNAGANVVSMSLGSAGQSVAERNAFDEAFAAGVLSIAAAGNGASTAYHFPASYPSVISVGGVDANEAHYTSSQRNDQVDVAAPAVAVLSTVSFVSDASLTVGGEKYRGSPLSFSQSSGGTAGPLALGGLCDAPNAAWAGKVVLCERGSVSFLVKVQSVEAAGGVAAAIYNNAPGHFTGTLGEGNGTTIPAISVSREDGLAIAGSAGEDALVVSISGDAASMGGYAFFNGTSMATPHVSAVAALLWSYNPSWTNAQIRDAIEATARDIGVPGRDDLFGHGIVQAKAALDYLCPSGCPPEQPFPAPTSQCFVDTSEGDFDTGITEGLNPRISPGDLKLKSTGDVEIDQQDVTASNSGFGFNNTVWFGQTFTAGATGQLVRVDLRLFCSGCGAVTTPPDVIVSIRDTAADLPTGADLAQATIPGFTSGAGNWYSANFATPVPITAGTQYAIVVRSASAISSGVYAYIAAPAATPDTYPAGRRVTSGNSGATWGAPTAGRDINFKTYATGTPPFVFDASGLFGAAIIDSVPGFGFGTQWNTLSWNAATPAGTALGFQVAGSHSAGGPFDFVGPDGTSATFFTTSGVPLSQFDGFRYLRYRTAFATSDPSASPMLHDVTTCVGTQDVTAPVITGEAVDKPVLWSPNHKMIDILVSYSVTDNSGSAAVTLSVSSNEAVDENGSGNTSPDWEILDNQRVRLRAERSGTGTGRVYTIVITATDEAGNSSSKQVHVTVPHNR
jgi:subtilisin family serine protease